MTKNCSRSFRLVCPPELAPRVEALLRAQGFAFEPEPFSPLCRALTAEPVPLGSSLAAFFGLIYIQDRSSMLPPLALAPAPGSTVLDMCASPGSKTGFLAQLAGPAGFVLGNEPARPRLATLRANLHALNLLQAATCSCPGERLPLPDGVWDYIQLDPPCSGWGTAEKNPRVRTLWQGDKVRPLIALQRRLLERAARLLRPGGRLVYSTCTTNEAENEAQVRYAEEELGLLRIPLPPFDGFAWEDPRPGGEGTLRVDGARSGAQGFYIAAFTRPGEAANPGAPEQHPSTPPATALMLSPEVLRAPCAEPNLLPPGSVAVFGDAARFLPRGSAALPGALTWQGALLGKVSGGRPRLSSRLRALMPSVPPPAALVLDDIRDIQALLQGQSRDTDLPGRETGLYWRDLPLARVTLKNGRALWRA